jgi:WXG100 family type VII secretion target
MGVVVDPDRLRAVATTTRDVGEGIALNLARLLNEIETQAPGFRGDTGKAFSKITDRLSSRLKTILENLNAIADSVDGSSTAFGTTDAAAASEINSVVHQYLPGATNVADQLRGGTA